MKREICVQGHQDRFIANASHELHTPLSTLKLLLYLARHEPDSIERHLAAMDSTLDHIIGLAQDLLDYSRFEHDAIPLEIGLVPLQPLIQSIIELQRLSADDKGIELLSNLPTEELYANIDAKRITQVVTNLVVNAIKYTGEGGTVTVHLTTREESHVPNAIIDVIDTGIGISEEFQAQIFEPFVRAHQGAIHGTGLGLTIAKEIVDLHGGQIQVRSRIDKGSTFTVMLPIE